VEDSLRQEIMNSIRLLSASRNQEVASTRKLRASSRAHGGG